jgi:transcriptional regulator with XRE-family HTH domain
MIQPNLGKKMAELRKAKGLTQEALAEKCNVNVRTLQRIESGEVTPRSYTAKLIFAALDFNLYESNKSGSLSFYWLEQFYIYFLDLFNLKTHKMKKITILSIMSCAIILGLFALVSESKAQKENKATTHLDKDSSIQTKNSGMAFSYFSATNFLTDKDDLIGRDVKFTINGINANVELIKINQKTREFMVGIGDGKLSQNKIEITCPKDVVNDEHLKYSADKIEKSEDKIFLKGHSRITFAESDYFETAEIIITLF